jgi:hypothetical protein
VGLVFKHVALLGVNFLNRFEALCLPIGQLTALCAEFLDMAQIAFDVPWLVLDDGPAMLALLLEMTRVVVPFFLRNPLVGAWWRDFQLFPHIVDQGFKIEADLIEQVGVLRKLDVNRNCGRIND